MIDRPLVIATRNKGKIEELKSLFSGFPISMKSLNDFGPIPEPVEDGKTFEDNAYKKAHFTARVLGFPALADDSGLTVAALGGAPGVFSARYAGEGAGDEANIRKLLKAMEGVRDRKAAFECVIGRRERPESGLRMRHFYCRSTGPRPDLRGEMRRGNRDRPGWKERVRL